MLCSNTSKELNKNLHFLKSAVPSAVFIASDELSAIIPSYIEVDSVKEEKDWNCIKIVGEMPFGSVQGLIAEISSCLIKNNIGICVVSTFLTDWFFVKSKNLDIAIHTLKAAGWKFE